MLQIVVDDDHQPMVVNDADEFDKVVSVTWLPPSGEWSLDQLRAQVPRVSRPSLTDWTLTSGIVFAILQRLALPARVAVLADVPALLRRYPVVHGTVLPIRRRLRRTSPRH